MQILDSKEDLEKFSGTQNEFYLYGAGNVAKKILGFLPAKELLKLQGVIVTKLDIENCFVNDRLLKTVSDELLDRELPVIIATGKRFHEEIKKTLEQQSFKNIIGLSERCEKQLAEIKMNVDRELIKWNEITPMLERITPRKRLKALVVNVCDHCNLNCRGCDHFSPIADKRFVSKEEIEKDVNQLALFIKDDVDVVNVMGGEPLLHPNIAEILMIARTAFRKSEVWLSTNGLLLLNQPEEFWQRCCENDIVINVTKYPVNFDYDKAKTVAENHGVKFQFYHGGIVEKTLGKYPLDVNGTQDKAESFMHCFHANNECNMLNNGRLYPCTVAPNIPIFNKRYNMEIPLTEEDGLDIYAISAKEEIFKYLSKPMPVCRFCDVKNRTFCYSWGQSEKRIEEWV